MPTVNQWIAILSVGVSYGLICMILFMTVGAYALGFVVPSFIAGLITFGVMLATNEEAEKKANLNRRDRY